MIVHIGYHKTGTTFLQQAVFPRLKGLKYFDYSASQQFFDPAIFKNSLEFDKSEFDVATISESTLFSYESLVGRMGVGTYNAEIANRLKEIGCQKVIITIRRQQDMVESIYKEYLHLGGVLKPKDFLAPQNRVFDWSFVDCYPLISHYASLFGKENVLVVLNEEIKSDLDGVLQQLKTFTGASRISENTTKKKSANRSLSVFSYKLLRIYNHNAYNFMRPSHLISKKISTNKMRGALEKTIERLFSKKKKKVLIPADLIDKQLHLYRESNQRIEKEFGVNLGENGYYV